MAEYIEKQSLQDRLQKKKPGPANKRYIEGWNDAVMMFKSMVHGEKAADVAPVVHGRWKYYHKQNIAVCTNCSFERNLDNDFGRAISCPNCGAKMQ